MRLEILDGLQQHAGEGVDAGRQLAFGIREWPRFLQRVEAAKDERVPVDQHQHVAQPFDRLQTRVAEAHFGRPESLGELALVMLHGRQERLRIERVGPHHQRIFAVVAVVAAPDAHLFEGVLAVQALGDRVGRAHFQRHPARADFDAAMDQRDQQELADALAADIGMRSDRGHVRLVGHDPDAGVADDAAQLLLEPRRAGWLGRPQKAAQPTDEVAASGRRVRIRSSSAVARAVFVAQPARDDVVRHAIFEDLAAIRVLRPGLRK